jgi:uncharacterized protein with HEPN domain
MQFMSSRSWQSRIQDILTCIDNINQFVAGMDYKTFASDAKTIRAVAFELTTMGEASRAIPDNIRNRHTRVPWGKMQDIRNVIVHEYFRIDEEILWRTIQEDLPPLLLQLNEILKFN